MFQERIAAVGATTLRRNADAKRLQVARTVWSVGRRTQPRGFVAEWAMTLIVFLFATTTLVQAYVVPTGSMEGTLLVGDHMLVDRVTYSDPGSWGVAPAAVSRGGARRHRGLPLSRRCPPDIRQARHRNTRRPHPPGEQTGGPQRPAAAGTLHAAYRSADRRLTATTFPRRRSSTPRRAAAICSRTTSAMARRSFRPGCCSSWATTAKIRPTAATGASCRATYVVGKPLLVYWSYDAPTADLETWTLGHVADVMEHFFTKTRWDRMLLVPRSRQAEVAP